MAGRETTLNAGRRRRTRCAGVECCAVKQTLRRRSPSESSSAVDIRDGGGRVCCAGWLDYDVVEGTGAVQATGSEADEEVGSVVYPSGGRDGRGAELLPDYNSIEGMGAALPHLTMRRWRPSAGWYGSWLALGGGVARDGSHSAVCPRTVWPSAR